MRRLLPAALLTASLLATTGCGPEEELEAADLVLLGGKISTVDDENPEAEGVAIRGDRIVFVGSDEGARALIGPETRLVELEGRRVLPGFIEGHGHFYSLGESRLQLDLTSTSSFQAMVEAVRQAALETPAGEWILGRGWHQSKWEEGAEELFEGVPSHQALSAVSPDNPVLLTHASGHAAFANQAALSLAGVDGDTESPDGGEIVHDGRGQPTGYLRETAQQLVRRVAPEGFDDDRARRVIELAGTECLAKGITSFQDAGSPVELVDFYTELAKGGELPIRLWVMVRDSNEKMAPALDRLRTVDLGNHFLTVRGIKKAIDGALGAHGAWLLEPYDDLPSSSGLNTTPLEEIEEAADLALAHDYQLCVHAIGDRANRETLDLYERKMGESSKDRRWRIEHAQHLHPDDIPRFGQLGVIASMQGVHCTSDGPWVPDRLGAERSESGAYVWRRLLDSGAVISNGTDTPVEDVDPIASFYASVSRRLMNGEVFYGEQRMTRQEALRSYTLDAAFAAFEEGEKGSIEVGKLADLVVLSKDIMTLAEEEIPSARVDTTILGGAVVYERE